MCGGGVLLFLLGLLSHVVCQLPPPFNLNALFFNISTRVGEGAEVRLRCEYSVRPQPLCGFTMIISFVGEASLTPAQLEAASSTQFLFPDDIREAHEELGRVVNKAIYTPEMKEMRSVVVTARFCALAGRAGSYICQMVPIDAKWKKGWTLTRWMRLEVYHDPASVKLLWIPFPCFALLTCLYAIYCTCRHQRIVFKRVVVGTSEPYEETACRPPRSYHRANVTLVPETWPPLRVYLKALHQQRELHQVYEAEEGSEGVKKERKKEEEEVRRRVRYLMPLDPAYDVDFGGVQVEGRLGEGVFGVVFRGTADHLPGGITGPLPVAIKTLRGGSSEADVVAFVQEMEMMKFIGKHENVIQIYATSSYNGRPVSIMEYAAEGSLLDYLRRNRSCLANQLRVTTESMLLCFALQVANGMAYLASKGIVHRDLAARNVLMTRDLVAKVADFGLTRKVEFYYRMRGKGLVPLKWMAPECVFHKVFTTKSDVWSFGVLLWEVFSLGDAPAATVSVKDFLQMLRVGGASLYPRPEYAGEGIFTDVMQQCWQRQPECRPTFIDLVATLSRLSQGI